MTQRGARQGFQAHLRSRGVEVMEFDFLTPDNVADYCYQRGFLQVRSARLAPSVGSTSRAVEFIECRCCEKRLMAVPCNAGDGAAQLCLCCCAGCSAACLPACLASCQFHGAPKP